MSQVKIQGNASGTGIFTVSAPNSNTDRTLTLPDVAGTLVSDDGSGKLLKSQMPSGSVIQVVQNTTASTTSTTTTGTWIAIADYSITITPSSSTSKILLLGSCNLFADADSDGQTATGSFRGLRNGSVMFTTDSAILARGGQQHFSSVDIKHLDSPSSTSALTYTFEFYIASTNRAVIANSLDKATLIALEIAA